MTAPIEQFLKKGPAAQAAVDEVIQAHATKLQPTAIVVRDSAGVLHNCIYRFGYWHCGVCDLGSVSPMMPSLCSGCHAPVVEVRYEVKF